MYLICFKSVVYLFLSKMKSRRTTIQNRRITTIFQIYIQIFSGKN